jgi:hypothetical protein
VTIQYAIARRDLWMAYRLAWRRIPMIGVTQAVTFLCTFYVGRSLLAPSALRPAAEMALAALVGILPVAVLVLYPYIRFKPETRTFSIDSAGIRTFIGTRSGEVSWTQIVRVERVKQHLVVLGRTGNSFIVPDHAFASVAERDAFERQVRAFVDEAHRA